MTRRRLDTLVRRPVEGPWTRPRRSRRVIDADRVGWSTGIEPDQLDNPSPCDAWTVRDVLNHITGGADDVRDLRA